MFTPNTWAQWLVEETGMIKCGVQILKFDEQAGGILDVTPSEIPAV